MTTLCFLRCFELTNLDLTLRILPESYYFLDCRVCVCCVCVCVFIWERERELVIRAPLRTNQVITWYISRFMIGYSTLQKLVHYRLWVLKYMEAKWIHTWYIPTKWQFRYELSVCEFRLFCSFFVTQFLSPPKKKLLYL